MNQNALILLLSLNFCHWAADYTHLSTKWMLSAKRNGKPLLPIFCHAFIHAWLFFVAIWFVKGAIIALAGFIITLWSHFVIDVLKGRMNIWFPSLTNPANVFHWWVFGADQFLHQAVIIIITYISI
jgi:hypothetical protein